MQSVEDTLIYISECRSDHQTTAFGRLTEIIIKKSSESP